MSNIMFILGCIFLGFYGLYYNSFSNIWIMLFTVPFILFRSLQIKRLRFDINFLFLAEAFLIKATLDQRIGRASTVATTIAIPMLMYIFGKLLVCKCDDEVNETIQKRVKTSLLILSISTLILGLLNYHLTSKSPIKFMGYYSVAFTHNEFYTDIFSFCFNYIFIVSIFIAVVVSIFYKKVADKIFLNKIKGIILASLLGLYILFVLYNYCHTANYFAMRQGLEWLIKKPGGNFGLNLTYNNSTMNMWLEYARDYGVLVFGPLFVFFILTIKDALKLTFNKNVGIFTKSIVLPIFVFINIYYSIGFFAYTNPQFWYIGLIVCGMLSEVAAIEENQSSNIKLTYHGKLDAILENRLVDSFALCILCATVFTVGLCHWVLDVEYKKIASNINFAKVDLNIVFYITSILIVFYLLKIKQMKFDYAMVLLCQTYILIGVLDYHSGRYSMLTYVWLLPSIYILGKVSVGNNLEEANNRIEKLYFVMAIGIFITTLLDFSMNFKYQSVYGFQLDKWPSFWLGGLWENRCTYELGFVLITTAAGYLIYSAKRNVFCIVFLILSNVVIQKLVISVTGRENRLLLPLGLLIFITLYLCDHWKTLSTKIKKLVYVMLLLAFAGIILFILAFINNWFGLYDRYLDSNWSSTGGILTNIRFGMDIRGFKAMLKHPFEDYWMVYGIDNPHSMLLEYGRVFGLAIWLLLTIFRLLIIKDAILLAINKNRYSWIKYLLVPAFMGINLYYSMELNGYAHRYLWMIGLFLSGMIRGWLDKEKCNG